MRRGSEVRGGEPAAHGRAVRGNHLHTVQLAVRDALDLFQHAAAQSLEHGGGGGGQVLRAGLRAREPGALEYQHRRAGAGEERRGRGARGPAPNDDGVPRRRRAAQEPGAPPQPARRARRRRRGRRDHGDQRDPSAAAAAPTSVVARFTPSLSSHRQPLTSRIGSWHTVSPRSDRASHLGHAYIPCTVAPRTESATMPNTPAAVPVANPAAMLTVPRGATSCASPAMSAAPTTPPADPSTVIPPEVPRDTSAPVVISRGGTREKDPISVAQVSAVAAAKAPVATAHMPASAASAATPPLATTWRAVRRGPRPSAKWPSRLPDRKNTSRSARPGHPRPQPTAAPTATAAATPPRVSQVTLRTGRAGSCASARGARRGPGSGLAGSPKTTFRSRSARRREGSRRGVGGSLVLRQTSIRGRDIHTGAPCTRDTS